MTQRYMKILTINISHFEKKKFPKPMCNTYTYFSYSVEIS